MNVFIPLIIALVTPLVVIGIRFVKAMVLLKKAQKVPRNYGKRLHWELGLFNWIEIYCWGLGLVCSITFFEKSYSFGYFIPIALLFYLPILILQLKEGLNQMNVKDLKTDLAIRLFFLLLFALIFWFFEITRTPFEWLPNLF